MKEIDVLKFSSIYINLFWIIKFILYYDLLCSN